MSIIEYSRKRNKKVDIKISYFDYCFTQKINNISINKTTITDEEGYLVIRNEGEDPFILFYIYLAYKLPNDDSFIKIKIKKNIFEYIGKSEVKIEIKNKKEGVFNMIPNLVINGKNTTKVN